jgi:hypothetical protein
LAGYPVFTSAVEMESPTNGTRWPLIGTVATLIFSLAMAGSALLFLSGAPKVAQSLAALGYPGYVAKILGVAKLLGVAALWLPVPKTLKEWAFAGFVFNLGGAIVSHLASAGARGHALQPAALLVLLLVSYALWHRGATESSRSSSLAARTEAWR